MVEIKKDKHIYAAYANMAHHNYFMTLGNIVKCLGLGFNLSTISEKDTIFKLSKQIEGYLKPSKKEDEKMKTINLLSRAFPFLLPMYEALDVDSEAKAFRELLSKITFVLNFYRNYTTHYEPDEDNEIERLNKCERSLVPCMKDLFKASLRTVQTRFGYDEKDMSFIKNKNMGKVDFNYSIFKKEVIVAGGKPESIFSNRGLVFFISLFLEKKYIKEMLDKTKVFYTQADLQSPKRKSIIFESLAVYRVRLPKKRYDSEQSKVALALDMVNELQRCPMNLFDILSPDDQNLFRSEPKDDNDPNSMLMIRHDDRFPQLALKYIDMMGIFNQARFQVNLGKYRYAFYDKRCINASENEGNNYVRSLEKELHGFGRLQEIEQERREKWATLIRDFDHVAPDTADSLPYITDHHASYMIHNNRIGLYWDESMDEDKPVLPQLHATPQAQDLRQRKKTGEPIVSMTSPKCFMSTHELPFLIFYHLLLGELSKEQRGALKVDDAEKLIMNWYKSFKAFVGDAMSGEISKENARERAERLGLKYPHDLPKKLVDFIEKNVYDSSVNSLKLKERLTSIVEETKQLRQRIEKDVEAVNDKRNRRGTRKFVEIKPGRLGSWLAHDIIKLQPTPKDGGKLTGLNFQILQSALSIYDDFDRVKRILVGAHLIMHDDAHPFLMNVVKEEPRDTLSFYRRYLHAKLQWLEKIPSTDLTQYGFLTRGVDKWSERNDEYYHRVMQRYLDTPVELPRGLFAEPIKRILASLYGKDFIKGDRRDEANTSFLISKYLHRRYDDDCQEFYTQPNDSYKRYYSFFKILQGQDNDYDYGMTVAQIDNFLRNDTSLRLISNVKDDVIDEELLTVANEEIQLKLAKALAKNPNINKENRIREIIANSKKLGSLTSSQQNAIITHALKGTRQASAGLVADYLNRFDSKQEREQEKLFLSRALHKMKNEERQIRRYKVEDVVLFFMAKHILFENDREMFTHRFRSFKLKNIKPIRCQGGESALEISVPFSITLKIKGSNVPVCITQDSIKLKNYGDFMRFIFDTRINTLIPYLVDDENAVAVKISRDELEDEFANYDRERFEVFANVHKIEQLILEKHRELKDKSSTDYYFIEGNRQIPVRGSFSAMLSYAQAYSEKDGAEVVNIRNSFAHNAYKGENFDKVDINTKTIGEIAPALSSKMEEKVTKLKKKDN